MGEQQVMIRERTMNGRRDVAESPRRGDSQALYERWICGLWAGERIAEDLVSEDFVGHWPTHDVHGPDELQTHRR